MTRSVCCLALTCLVAACVPPKAEVVAEAPAAVNPKQGKPQARGTEDETPPALPLPVAQESGMRDPDLTGKLPDKKDMTPTAVPPAGAGATVIATPPKE